MRWYNIAAKLYDLDQNDINRAMVLPAKRFITNQAHPDYVYCMKLTYHLNMVSLSLQIKEEYHMRLQMFNAISQSKDLKEQIKIQKIVHNIKQYSEYMYRQYIKSMRAYKLNMKNNNKGA